MVICQRVMACGAGASPVDVRPGGVLRDPPLVPESRACHAVGSARKRLARRIGRLVHAAIPEQCAYQEADPSSPGRTSGFPVSPRAAGRGLSPEHGDERSDARCRLFHLRLRLLQPEPHVHLAVHRRGSDEVLLSLLARACSPVELAEAEVAVGDRGAHAELVSQRHRAPEVGLCGLHVGGIAAGRHLAEEAKGVDLVAALPVAASQVERVLPSCAASSTPPVESNTSPSGMAPSRWSETKFIEAAWSATLRSRGMASVVRFASAYAAPRNAAIPWNTSAVSPKVWQI